MPEPRVVIELAVAVLALTGLLSLAAATVTVRGTRCAARLDGLQRDLHAGRPVMVRLDDACRMSLALSGARTPADLARLLPESALRELRADAVRTLPARSWRQRLRAAQILCAVGPLDPLVRLLGDEVPVVRAVACAGIGPGSDEHVLTQAAALLADPDGGVRHAAAEAITRCGPRASAALARQLALAPPDDVRAAALQLAAGPGAHSLLPYADAAVADPNPQVRRAAAHALVAVGDPYGRLRLLLEDPDPAVAAAACRAVGALREARLAASLAAALRSPSWDLRTAAAGALGTLGPPGTLLLRAAVHGDDAFARDAALAALALVDVPVELAR